MSGLVAVAVMVASFAVALVSVVQLAGLPRGVPRDRPERFTWITSGVQGADFSLRVDPLSALMLLVVTGIGSLIHIYSTAYMHEEPDSEYARYFSYLNLFAAFMLVLVLGSNFLVMFVGWEGVGLCSYLLIGFYYAKKSASDAGKKAFIVNRIGDFGFVLGVLLLFVKFGTSTSRRSRTPRRRSAPRRHSARSRSPRCCSSSGPPASPRRSRCTCGCPTPWRARHRCRRSSMLQPW